MNDLSKNEGLNSRPTTGKLRIVNVNGNLRYTDSTGRQYRIRPEAGTPVHATNATQTLTLAGRAVADETIVVGGVTYTWKASVTAANEVKVGASTAADDVLSLVAAINASVSTTLYGTGTVANPYWSAADGAGDTVVLTARTTGPVAGGVNSEAMTNASFGTLTNGIFATTASAGDRLYDASYLYLANVNIDRYATSGWERIATTAF